MHLTPKRGKINKLKGRKISGVTKKKNDPILTSRQGSLFIKTKKGTVFRQLSKIKKQGSKTVSLFSVNSSRD